MIYKYITDIYIISKLGLLCDRYDFVNEIHDRTFESYDFYLDVINHYDKFRHVLRDIKSRKMV